MENAVAEVQENPVPAELEQVAAAVPVEQPADRVAVPTSGETTSTAGKTTSQASRPIAAPQPSPDPGEAQQAAPELAGPSNESKIPSQLKGPVGVPKNPTPLHVIDADMSGGPSNGAGPGRGFDSTVDGLIGGLSSLGSQAGQLALSAAAPGLSIPPLNSILDPVPAALSELIATPAAGLAMPTAGVDFPLPALNELLDGRQAAAVGMSAPRTVLEGTAGAAARTGNYILPFETTSFDTIADSSGKQPAPGDPGNIPGNSSGAGEGTPNGLSLFGFAALLLVALMAAAPAIRRLIQIASACWQPVPFVALLERPG